jgi:hypothetical protein
VGDDISVDSETLFVIDFMNFKIKSAQSFRCTHKDSVYIHVFIRISVRTCVSIFVCSVFQKKSRKQDNN